MEQEVKERESQTHAIGALRAASLERRVPRLVGSSANERGDGEGGRVGRREREIGGIRQLPLNVFNAAVEARKRSVEKRSVGRSVARSLALSVFSLSLVGMEPCGPAVVLLLLLRVPLSTSVLSLYT